MALAAEDTISEMPAQVVAELVQVAALGAPEALTTVAVANQVLVGAATEQGQ